MNFAEMIASTPVFSAAEKPMCPASPVTLNR
jgi:hypothetical protein